MLKETRNYVVTEDNVSYSFFEKNHASPCLPLLIFEPHYFKTLS